MRLAEKMSRLGSETAFSVLVKAQALEAKGMDVVHMEIGEPDFPTPKNIRGAGIRALEAGYTTYCNSQGLLALRTEVSREFEKTRGISPDPERIVITPGAKPLMFYSIISLLEEGDEAIYPNPLFPIFESMINFSGARAVPVPLREDLGFRFNVDELKDRVTKRTKLIIINSPENPTGSILEPDDLQAIADIALENDITILSDEIYDHLVYEGRHNSIASLPGMLDRTILLSGFSKTYSMTGWRLGYAAMPAELVDPVVRLIVNSVSCTAPFVQYAGIEALTGGQESLDEMMAEFRKRRDVIVTGLNDITGISCVQPKGAFYAFPNISGLGMKSSELSDYLLNEAGVATLAGTDFGEYGEGYIRLSYATSLDNINRALERINDAAVKLRG
ncbi:MAG: pyridoxal phosphate-dependent aminotransferase [Dehalococcoidales bacterium]